MYETYLYYYSGLFMIFLFLFFYTWYYDFFHQIYVLIYIHCYGFLDNYSSNNFDGIIITMKFNLVYFMVMS